MHTLNAFSKAVVSRFEKGTQIFGGDLAGDAKLLVLEAIILAEEDVADRTEMLTNVFSLFAFRMAMGSIIGLSIA